MTIIRTLAALLAAAALSGASAPPPGGAGTGPPSLTPAGKPQRIVSLNLCTDQLLLQLVEPRRIRAVTYLAADPRSSGMARAAARVPLTRGDAEDVIAMRPDLVLAGTFSTRETVAILRRLGYPVLELAPESDFASIKANIAQLAGAVGEPARGARMIAAIDAALAVVPPPSAERPVYADYQANGFTSGDGALITEVANAAGFDTLAQRLGLPGTRQVSLEQLLVTPPDVIDLGEGYGGPALATENYRHPVLRRLMRERQVVRLPGKYTACGSPLTLRALDALVQARRQLG